MAAGGEKADDRKRSAHSLTGAIALTDRVEGDEPVLPGGYVAILDFTNGVWALDVSFLVR